MNTGWDCQWCAASKKAAVELHDAERRAWEAIAADRRHAARTEQDGTARDMRAKATLEADRACGGGSVLGRALREREGR